MRPKFLPLYGSNNFYLDLCFWWSIESISLQRKFTSENQSGTNSSSCTKNGLSYVCACEECRGVGCFNSVEEDIADIMGNEEDHDDEKRNIFDDLFF